MRVKQKPLLIKTNDVQRLLALSDRQARRVLQHVRHFNQKQPQQPVTFKEFSTYTGLDLETMYGQLGY
ncbi:MAG TPA: hypothetical protein VGM63_19335 [Mucilaginibacter sp.]|jgi:hypothetical protein